MLGMWRMLRVLGVVRVFRMIGMRRMLWVLGVLGWPLLTAPSLPGRAAKRMLLDLHAEIMRVSRTSERSVVCAPPLIGIANGGQSVSSAAISRAFVVP
jgi:hypothetical protein